MIPISPTPSSNVNRFAVSLARWAAAPPEADRRLAAATISSIEITVSLFQAAVFFERHPLDESDDDAFVTRELGELLDLSVVEPAQKHTVYFDRPESYRVCLANACQHLVEAVEGRA